MFRCATIDGEQSNRRHLPLANGTGYWRSDLLISAVTASNTFAVADEAARRARKGGRFLDLNSASPGTKQRAAAALEAVGDAYAIASNYLRKTGAIPDTFATNDRLLEIIIAMFHRGEYNRIRLANKAISQFEAARLV